MPVIAEAKLLFVYPDGACVPVRLGVRAPFSHQQGDWACEIFAEGLRIWQGSKAMCGIDSWQALTLALCFLREMVDEEERQGAIVHWPDEESQICAREFFALHRME